MHAYADYAEVIRTGNPQDFGFLSAIGGFWSSTCALSKASGPHGGFPWGSQADGLYHRGQFHGRAGVEGRV